MRHNQDMTNVIWEKSGLKNLEKRQMFRKAILVQKEKSHVTHLLNHNENSSIIQEREEYINSVYLHFRKWFIELSDERV